MSKKDIVMYGFSYALIAVILCLQGFYFKESPLPTLIVSYAVCMVAYLIWVNMVDTKPLESLKTPLGTFLLLVIPYGLASVAIGASSAFLAYLSLKESLLALTLIYVAIGLLVSYKLKNNRDKGLTA